MNVKFKETVCTGHIGYNSFVLATWKDLFDPQNGFVNDNSTVIEVQMEKFDGLPSIAKKRRATDSLETYANVIRLDCAICLENIKNASSTLCGHIFCTKCIKRVIRSRKRCHSCNSPLNLKKLHRIYLPL